MDISLFLAKILGFYLVIIGIACIFKRDFFRRVFEDFYKNSALIALASILNLFIGLLIILNHNVWEFSWKSIITVVGYLSLFKGILNLFFPDWGKNIAKSYSTKDLFVYSGVISLVLGLYLLYHGYSIALPIKL